jgi:transposase
MATPFAATAQRLAEIPGINVIAACAIVAEIGTDMSRFPTAGHLVSWAKFAPGVKESAGKKKGKNTTGHGNRYLARVPGNAAASAGRTDTFPAERYRRIARRRGSKKAVVAAGRSMLVIIWHLLAGPGTHYAELGSDFYDTRINPARRKRNHIRQLEALGYRVTLEPAA